MFDRMISRLERLSKIQPQLTILIFMIVYFGKDILLFVSSFFGALK